MVIFNKRMRANVVQNAEQKQLHQKATAEVKELEQRLRGNDDDLLYAKSHIEGLQQEIDNWHNRGVCVRACMHLFVGGYTCYAEVHAQRGEWEGCLC